LLKEVSLISDNKGEYFWLKIFTDSSLISLEKFIILETITLTDANIATVKIIDEYADILDTISPFYLKSKKFIRQLSIIGVS
jgi:hypothetical protein